MSKKILPTPEELRQLLRYEPETGKLYWKERPASMFKTKQSHGTWNTRFAGKEAFTAVGTHGYRVGSVNYKTILAHRVVWAIHYGSWPSEFIDHVDNDGLDNRIDNLREATASENGMNRGRQENSTSGYKGVHWHSGNKAFHAQICVAGKRICLGLHATAEAAHAAYCAAAEKYHGEFARTG